MYIKRAIEQIIIKISQQFPILVVTGPHQIGKTTLLKQLANKGRNYVTLDDPLIRELAKNDPALFMQRYAPPLLIDEIQYAPELFPYLKMSVDNNSVPGSYWLTGSQQFHLMKNVSESLAGRVAITNLWGFSRCELLPSQEVSPFIPIPDLLLSRSKQPNLNLNELFHTIWLGSFPALHQQYEVDRELFYASNVQTYLQRDVRDLAQVGDENSFLRFIRVCAARIGGLLNIQDLSRDADINNATAKKWLSILESSGIVFLLQPYHTNVSKRLIRSPKLYFNDTGLAAWLSGWSTPETLEMGAMAGAFLENWVIMEIRKSYFNAGKQPQLYYYRDRDSKEIDLLIFQDGILYPIEIKKTASPRKEMIKAFELLTKLGIPVGSGGVISLSEHFLPLTEKYHTIPMGWL